MWVDIGHVYMQHVYKAARLMESKQDQMEDAAGWGIFAERIQERKFLEENDEQHDCKDAVSALTGAVRISGGAEMAEFEDALIVVKAKIEEASQVVDFDFAATVIDEIRNGMTTNFSAFIDKRTLNKMERVLAVHRSKRIPQEAKDNAPANVAKNM